MRLDTNSGNYTLLIQSDDRSTIIFSYCYNTDKLYYHKRLVEDENEILKFWKFAYDNRIEGTKFADSRFHNLILNRIESKYRLVKINNFLL